AGDELHRLDAADAQEPLDGAAEPELGSVLAVDVADSGGGRQAKRLVSGSGATSTSVTARPSWRAAAATSHPMKPAPITTRRGPAASSARSATASSTVRRT